MTEEEWLVCDRPTSMFAFLRDHVGEGDRKLLLFSIVCCRLVMESKVLSFRERHRRAIETIERHADGLATAKQMQQACKEIPTRFGGQPSEIVLQVGRFSPGVGARLAARGLARGGSVSPQACHLLRDFFGNPFHPVTLDRSWLTSTVTSLARAIYDDRQLPAGHFDNQRMGILADALEESGCDNADILNHCRQPGEHVRGCWVVDALLGKQ